MDCTWIDGESGVAGVERATGATAAIGWSDRRSCGWHPLGFVENDSECVECMIYSELDAHSTAVAVAVVVVVAAVAVAAAVAAVVVVAAAVVVVAAAAAVFVADPLTANNDAGFVSVPLGPPINPITSNV